jgi:hypothetical protein
MAAFSYVLLRLYPRSWRRRYGSEMQDLLSKGDLSLRTVADVIAGAIDARFNPQTTTLTRTAVTEGDRTMTNVFRCNVAGVSKSDQWRSAAWLAGGSLVLTLMGILVQIQIGKNSFSEGMLYAAFPASLMLSSECTYLRQYSPRARIVMSVGGALLVVMMMWGAVAIGRII